MKKIIFGPWQWYIFVLFIAVVFYQVCPKYEFQSDKYDRHERMNRITGKVEYLHEGSWEKAYR